MKFVALGLFFVLVVVFFPLIPVVNGNVVKATVSVLQDDKKTFLIGKGFCCCCLFFHLICVSPNIRVLAC